MLDGYFSCLIIAYCVTTHSFARGKDMRLVS